MNTLNRITWTDEEKDIVTIRSDEELVFALAAMKGPVYKLAVEPTPFFPEMLKQIKDIEAESTTNQEMVPFRQPSDGYGPPNGGRNRVLGASGPPPVGCNGYTTIPTPQGRYRPVPYEAPQAFFAPAIHGVQPGCYYFPNGN
jgi:hypothetical protein